MTETEFHQHVDALFIAIEEALDNYSDVDFDYESAGGILSIILPDQSKIILNKQPPLLQIWMATKFNGHHFNFDGKHWIDERFGGELFAFLDEALAKQAGVPVTLSVDTYL